MTEDTKSCFINGIDDYYLEDNILKRCHENCLQCISNENKNCKKCQTNYYMTIDTHSCYNYIIDYYYLEDNILKNCDSRCIKCDGPLINSNYMNCITCKEKYYLLEETKSCYKEPIDGYYIDEENKKLKKCHPNCLKCINNENKNCLECRPNFYLTEDTNFCFSNPTDYYYLDEQDNKLRKCHENCKRCKDAPENDNNMNCIICQPNLYLTEDTYSCFDYIPDHYYLDDDKLRRCHERCFNCFGAWDDETMNCTNCINDLFFYRKDTNNCVLKNEFGKDNYIQLQKTENINFYIFITIFIISIVIYILLRIFYKVKEEDNSLDKKEKNKKLNLKINNDSEMEEIKSDNDDNNN